MGCNMRVLAWARARSPMAHRMIELGRSVHLNTAVLLGISVRAYHPFSGGISVSWGRIVA
jgi:hypothetical protein